jgi:hypothetical protein
MRCLYDPFIQTSFINETVEKVSTRGCSKTVRCKALEILRSESYLCVRRNDKG